MGAIHVLMAATIICTYLISAKLANDYKLKAGASHSSIEPPRAYAPTWLASRKQWRAGANLPSLEELRNGCFMIAQDAAQSG